jgi:hypothetical protein
MYNLMLGLPFGVDAENISCYFDCKIRRLFVHARRLSEQPPQSAGDQEQEVADTEELKELVEGTQASTTIQDEDDEVVEIDTDDYFKREKQGTVFMK